MSGQDKKISQVVEDYLAYRRPRVSPTTWTQESYVLRRFARDVPDIQVRHLTAEHVGTWFYGPNGVASAHMTKDGRDRKPVQASTYNYYRRRLKGLFAYATKRALTKVDLLDGVSEQPEFTRVRQQPTPEELLALLEHAENPRDRGYLAVAVNTGGRASEITSLLIGDVDFEKGQLRSTIRKSREEDLFPITSDLDTELRRWLTAYAGTMDRPLRTTDFLFPACKPAVWASTVDAEGKVLARTVAGWDPARPVSHTERIVHKALREIGLPTLYEGTHTIRRAVARAKFEQCRRDVGYDNALRDVMTMLHHKSQLTTERYLGVSADKQRRDEQMRGKPFLTAIVAERATDNDNVVNLGPRS